jgi:hypothetical protein
MKVKRMIARRGNSRSTQETMTWMDNRMETKVMNAWLNRDVLHLRMLAGI